MQIKRQFCLFCCEPVRNMMMANKAPLERLLRKRLFLDRFCAKCKREYHDYHKLYNTRNKICGGVVAVKRTHAHQGIHESVENDAWYHALGPNIQSGRCKRQTDDLHEKRKERRLVLADALDKEQRNVPACPNDADHKWDENTALVLKVMHENAAPPKLFQTAADNHLQK